MKNKEISGLETLARWEKNLYILAGVLAIISHLVIAVISPFYEIGASVYITPILSLSFVYLFILYLRINIYAYRLSLYYALSAVILNSYFLGQSNEYYGDYVKIMYCREIFQIFGGMLILIVYFLPNVRKLYKSDLKK